MVYKEKCLTYSLTLVNSNAIRYCMEPKKNNNKKTHHQTHALMSLRPPVSALKLLLLSYLSEEAPLPPFYFPNINIRVHSSSCIPANSHSSSSWLALVQPSGIRSSSVSSTCPLPCDYNQSECQCRKAACPEGRYHPAAMLSSKPAPVPRKLAPSPGSFLTGL